jgi:hypothetical protein
MPEINDIYLPVPVQPIYKRIITDDLIIVPEGHVLQLFSPRVDGELYIDGEVYIL